MIITRKFLEFCAKEKATIQMQLVSYPKSTWQVEQLVDEKMIEHILEIKDEIKFIKLKFENETT